MSPVLWRGNVIQEWVRAKLAGGVVRARFGGFRLRWVAATLLWLTPAGAAEEPAGPGIVFEEVLPQASGIRWVHENAMSAQRHLPETVGPGCAFFDYDNDGWMDLYLVNSGTSDFYAPATPLRNALYRNDRDGTFTDVTEAAGVSGGRFGMGVAVADYDGDGWQDLYVTNYGPNDLYRNNGDGSFSEVAEDASLLAPGWSTSGVWFDYDGDGRLDLFVCSFVRYDQSLSRLCFDHLRKRTYYCLPTLFDPTPSHLFRNDGNGRFTDVSRESGIAGHPGKAFGVVATDVNNDGHLDLFVANDTVADFLFVNQGNGTFREMGLWAGVAFDDGGKPRSGMGVDATDYDSDGLQDLFVSNIDHEVFSLYRNQGDLTFTDEAADVGKLTWLLSGWGLRFFDADNDGDDDLFLANGHPDDMVEKFRPALGYREPLLYLENVNGRYRDRSRRSGAVFSRTFSARGLATGDLDNDGDPDLLITDNGGPPVLLLNRGGNRNRWVGLDLVSRHGHTPVGAVITWSAGGVERRRLKRAGGSYLSSSDPREILGLGSTGALDWVEIQWPSGAKTKLTDLQPNRYHKITESP